MNDKEMLLVRIAELKSQLAELEQPVKKVNRTSNNPRSPFYVTDYSRLVQVYNGFVAPEVLAMYEV